MNWMKIKTERLSRKYRRFKRLMKYDDLNDLVKSLQRTARETGKNLSELNIELREKCGFKMKNWQII